MVTIKMVRLAQHKYSYLMGTTTSWNDVWIEVVTAIIKEYELSKKSPAERCRDAFFEGDSTTCPWDEVSPSNKAAWERVAKTMLEDK